MTLIAHKLLDAIYGRDKQYTFTCEKGTQDQDVRSLASGIEVAEKFDFGPLPLEKAGDGLFKIPDLTTDEKGFWVEGLVPLPSDICWYEFELSGSRSGLLVLDEAFLRNNGIQRPESTWVVLRVDRQKDGSFSFDGVLTGQHRNNLDPKSDNWAIMTSGNKRLIDVVKRNGKPPHDMASLFGANFILSIYMTLMIQSRTTDVVIERAPEKLNAQRIKAGRTPLSDHRVISIVPRRWYANSEDEAKRTHTPPKLHWRMSHKRHFDHSTPGSKWMETEEWKGKTGWWVTVIPRYMVGKRELGEISHEYRVALGPKEKSNV